MGWGVRSKRTGREGMVGSRKKQAGRNCRKPTRKEGRELGTSLAERVELEMGDVTINRSASKSICKGRESKVIKRRILK